MSEQMNIYQKLAKIRKPAEVIQKNARGYGYTYVSEDEILAKITGLMNKYGVSLIPRITPGTMSAEPYTYSKTKSTKDGKVYEEKVNEVMVRSDMTWTWVNDENPDDCIVVPWALVASQTDASQAFGSGLTYASRYFLLKYFNIATSDEDPDEYRRKQRESEAEEDRLIAEKIVEQIHTLVTDHLAEKPDDKQKVITITKKYVKENGKASANYFALTSSNVASELLAALQAEFPA